MDNIYTTYSERLKRTNSGESAKRSLKRLKVALMVWIFSFLASIIWLTAAS